MYTLTQLGDHAVIIEWPQQIDTLIHQQVMGVFEYLQSLALPEIWDIVPAYASLIIVYKPGKDIRPLLEKAMEQITVAIPVTPRILEIPVCYDPAVALDISSMASHKGLSVEEIITLHTQQRYTVYMLGFLWRRSLPFIPNSATLCICWAFCRDFPIWEKWTSSWPPHG